MFNSNVFELPFEINKVDIYHMDPIKLEELFPEEPVFMLAGVEYHLRFVNVTDHTWIKSHIGDTQAIQSMFADLDWSRIGPFIYRLLVEKHAFPSSDIEEYSDDGDLVKLRLTGPDNFMRSIIGPEDQINVISALNSSIIRSSPLMAKYVKGELDKKKAEEEEKRIGEQSLTHSLMNTDGPQTSLKDSPLEK